MAKNNLFLGTASRSVGDVTLYRRNGTQVSRVRVREIANPKSYNQAKQRCFLAPVARFYAPLASCLERSWQGLNRSASYSAFLKENIKRARSQGWYVEKSAPYHALPYQVSQGTLPVTSYLLDETASVLNWLPGFDTNISTIGGLSQYLVDLGYANGDQVTVIAFFMGGRAPFSDGVTPHFARFFLDTSSTEPIRTAITGLIKIAPSDSGDYPGVYISASNESGLKIVAGAVIMSRFNGEKWQRSTQSVVLSPDYLDYFIANASKDDAIASYQSAPSEVNSAIYLNGSRVIAGEGAKTVDVVTANDTALTIVGFDFKTVAGLDMLCAVDSEGLRMPIKNADSNSYYYDKWLTDNNKLGNQCWSELPSGQSYSGDFIGIDFEGSGGDRDNWDALHEMGLTWSIWLRQG